MRYIICVLLAVALLASGLSEGGAAVSAVDAFIQRGGIEADAALREAIEALIEAKGLNPRIIGMMDEALVARYGEYLAAGLPIAYDGLLEGEPTPMEGDEDWDALRQLAVLQPEGAAVRSLLVDFERNRLYYDEAWPAPEDVCRASYAVELSGDTAGKLRDILRAANPAQWEATWPGDAAAGVSVLAMDFGGSVARYAAPGLGEIPEAFLETMQALLSAGAAAAGAVK